MATLSEAIAIAFAHHERGQLAEAEAIYRQVLEQQPQHADVLHRLGVLTLQSGRLDEAIGLLEQSVATNPNDAQAQGNLGTAYSVAGRYHNARIALEKAIRRDPSNAGAYCALGLALHRLGRLEDAAASYRSCLRLRPDFPSAQSNLGVTLQDLARFDEAQACYERALEQAPGQSMSHVNLGTVLKDQGKLLAAIECFKRALVIDPQCAQAHCGRGTVLLSRGDFAAGWPDYEYRVGCAQFNTFRFAEPRWDSSPLAGRTLLIHCEQGLGDTFQFIRYVKLINQHDGRVLVAAQPPLLPILAESGIGGLVNRSEPLPPFDVHAPLMSLPSIFQTTEATIPRGVPYLAVAAERTARWRTSLEQLDGFKIGIAWQGAPSFQRDRIRSIPLEYFASLAKVPGVRLVSLQKGPGCEQLATVANRFEVIDLGAELDHCGAFLDTAAIMQNLDLVVSSDTAAAHLAGALGVKVWVALGQQPEWRWMFDRPDSPWYPTMRLFRQQQPGDWPGVFQSMAGALKTVVEATS